MWEVEMEMGGYRTNGLDILMLTGINVMNGSSARMPVAALSGGRGSFFLQTLKTVTFKL